MNQARTSHETGKSWEGSAARYLQRRGWRVLERNFRAGAGEVDLIVRRGDEVAFVEVKGRRGRRTGSPLEAVSPQKVRRISAAAALYLARGVEKARIYRFDVVTVGPDRGWWGGLKVRHLPNAFEAAGNFNV